MTQPVRMRADRRAKIRTTRENHPLRAITRRPAPLHLRQRGASPLGNQSRSKRSVMRRNKPRTRAWPDAFGVANQSLTDWVASDLDRAMCFGDQSTRDATEPEPFQSAAKPAPPDKNCISIPLLCVMYEHSLRIPFSIATETFNPMTLNSFSAQSTILCATKVDFPCSSLIVAAVTGRIWKFLRETRHCQQR